MAFTDPRRRTKECRSYETGKAALEAWLLRHEERIARELVAAAEARGTDRA